MGTVYINEIDSQDLSVWKDKYQMLGDTVTFLIATCDDPIVIELKDRYTRLSSRWEELFPVSLLVQHFTYNSTDVVPLIL
jgi:hypothetical protein